MKNIDDITDHLGPHILMYQSQDDMKLSSEIPPTNT